MPLAPLSASFQSLPTLPTSKVVPSGADSQVGGLVYILAPCESLQQTFWCIWEFLLLPQPSQFFSVRGFEALFPHTGTLSCVVSVLLPSCSVQFFHTQMWDHLLHQLPSPSVAATTLPSLVLQPLPCHESSLPWLCICTPPTGLHECFFFNSLVLELPYSSVFWQFWLFFVFKFVVILLLVAQGGKVYIPTFPSWPGDHMSVLEEWF